MVPLKSWVLAAVLPLAAAGCDYASAKAESDDPTPEMAQAGEAHYTNYCAPCHGENGAGNPEVEAPSIAGLPYWYVERQLHNFRNGVRGVAYDDIAGKRMRPMAWALPSDKQVREVSAYVAGIKNEQGQTIGLQGIKMLETLRPDEVDLEKGKATYATCAACHGQKGLGNELLGSPKLIHLPDWYLVTQLKNFKSGVRGRHPEDTWGATMWPNAIGLSEQDMKNVTAYIQTLRSGS